jgi:hypothetical protein
LALRLCWKCSGKPNNDAKTGLSRRELSLNYHRSFHLLIFMT